MLDEVPSSSARVGSICHGDAVEPGILHRRRGIRVFDAHNRDCGDLILGPLGVQGHVTGNGRREVVGLRALRIGVPAGKRVALARGVLRPGGRLAVLDLLRGDRRALTSVERHGVGKCRKAVKVTVFDSVIRLDSILRRTDIRHGAVDVERPIAIGSIPIRSKNAAIFGLQRSQAKRVGLKIGAAGVLEHLLEHILCSLMVIILNGNLSQRHNGLGRTLGVASVTREPCHARFNDNCLSGIRIFDASCTQNRQRCRDILVRKLGIRGIVGIAFGIASVLLARQARRDRNLRVVLRLRNLKVFGCDNGAVARLKQTPILPGHRVIARQIDRNNTKGRRIGRCLVVAPGKVAVGIKISLLERVHVGRNGTSVLAIQNGGSIAGLRLFHKRKLGIKLVLVLRGNRKVEGLACRDLGVGLVGHRESDLSACGLGPGQRLVNRALVTVKRNVVGAGGVLDLVVLAVDIERARAWHLQVGG